MSLGDVEHEDFWNFLIGKVYIIHAHDCEINFGCWLQKSKCAFLDDDDENGSVQSQNLTMSCTILAVIQVGHCTRCITPHSWIDPALSGANNQDCFHNHGHESCKLFQSRNFKFKIPWWWFLNELNHFSSYPIDSYWIRDDMEYFEYDTCLPIKWKIAKSGSTPFFTTHLSISPLFKKPWAE